MADVLISLEWLEEDGNGNVNFAGKKYAVRRDAGFKNEVIKNAYGRDAAKLLMNQQLNNFMSTKIYNREFLIDNGIRFDESLDDDKAELLFQTEAFFKSKYFVYTAHACCVAPTKKGK